MPTNSIRRPGAVLLAVAAGVSHSGSAPLQTGTTAWHIPAARRINPLSATTPISAQ